MYIDMILQMCHNCKIMTAPGVGLELGEQYREQLDEQYGFGTAAMLNGALHSADLPHCEESDQTLSYLHLIPDQPQHDRPVLYVPGFSEGTIAKVPLAVELAERGMDVLFLDQNRSGILRSGGKRDATYSQAINNLAVLEQEGLVDGPVDVIAHSHGALVLQEMVRIARQREQTTFNGSNVVMLAPAGSNADENLVKLGVRFGHNLVSEARTDKDFPDPDGEMLKAGAKTLTANISRTVLEVWELARRRVDYRDLASVVANLMVLSYAEDRLFPDRVHASTMHDTMVATNQDTKDVLANFSWATPISWQEQDDGTFRMGKDASHNDEQFNPARVANSVKQLFRLAADQA